MLPKVSIIIPCYNVENVIDETLACLERQTNKCFEAVFVNDGSTDGTQSKLKHFKEKGCVSAVILKKANGGVSSARNAGMAIAQGEYLAFLDADDLLADNFVEVMLSAIDTIKADVAYCKLSRNLSMLSNQDIITEQIVSENAESAMNRLLFHMGEYGFYCYVYRRELLQKHVVAFDENCKYGEDREFIWKYIVHCEKFVSVNAILYGYRENLSSATKKKASWCRTDSLQAVRRVEKYMEEHNIGYLPVYADYMYARDMWAVAKAFAVTGARQCFKRLCCEYDVKLCMKRTASDSNKLVRLASILFLIHSSLFYYSIRLQQALKERSN